MRGSIWACLVDPAVFPDSAQRQHLFRLLGQCHVSGLLRAEDAAALLRDNFCALDPALLDDVAYTCLEHFMEQARHPSQSVQSQGFWGFQS